MILVVQNISLFQFPKSLVKPLTFTLTLDEYIYLVLLFKKKIKKGTELHLWVNDRTKIKEPPKDGRDGGLKSRAKVSM